MSAELEDFYTSLQDLDQWLDQAIELSEEYRESDEDIAMQYNKYKVWNNLIKIRSLLDALLAYSKTSIHATFHIGSCKWSYFQPSNQ